MYGRLDEATWVDVHEPSHGYTCWQSEHLVYEWHHVPVPNLKLLMGAWCEVASHYKANDEEFDCVLLIVPGLSLLLMNGPLPLE